MSQYIDRREAAKSYRPVAGSMSPGLRRAREPYRVKNAVLGLALGAFAVGVWAYSISAVKQDVFDDLDDEVVRLDTPAGPVSVPATGPGVPVPAALRDAVIVKELDTVRAKAAVPPNPSAPAPHVRGILQHLDNRWSTLLDPKTKTLVWGAPSVDNMGKMRDS